MKWTLMKSSLIKLALLLFIFSVRTLANAAESSCPADLGAVADKTAVVAAPLPVTRPPPLTITDIQPATQTAKLSNGAALHLDLKELNSQNMSAAIHVDEGHYKMSDTPPLGVAPHLDSGLHTYKALLGFLAKRPDLKTQMVVHVQKSSGILKIHLPRSAFSGSEWKQPWRQQANLMVHNEQGALVELRPLIIFPQDWTLETIQDAVNTSVTASGLTLHIGKHRDLAIYAKFKNVSLRIESWFDAPKNAWLLTSVYPQETREPWVATTITP